MSPSEVDIPPTSQTALDALTLLSKKWHPVVVVTLEHHDTLGFNGLLEAIPDVSGKVLSGTLEALGDAGIVERTVVSESPLRVEYELTDAGHDMKPVFDALGEWGEHHLESATPTVLIADADRRITDLYGQWLTDRYTVFRAHNYEELGRQVDANTDIVLFDEGLPGTSATGCVEAVGPDCRTIMLTGDRPGFELLSVECDDVLRKPIVRETALEAIDRQLTRRGESAQRREQASLAAMQSLFESVYPEETLDRIEEYQTRRSRLETLTDRLEE